jgi:hypothetical protein
MADEIPGDVRQFIERNIESLAQLELLLLLHNDKSRLWDAAELSKLMGFSTAMTTGLLRDLTSRGFAMVTGEKYRYGVADSATEHSIATLSETYRTRRVAVTTEIYSRPNKQLKSFADAFRVRKEQ